MRDKLMKLAYGRDDMGCFLEPSKRVRDLAEQALNACNACACGCEGTMGTESGMDNVVREMPPVDDRETRPSDNVPLPLGCPSYEDRLVVPPQMDPHEMVPTPVPLPEPEVIPTPTAASLLPGTRSVLVKAPAPAEPLPSAAPLAEAIWQPIDPGTPFAAAEPGDVLAFLMGIEQQPKSTRIAGQPTPTATGRPHADARFALAPTATPPGIPQPFTRPVIRSPLPPRPQGPPAVAEPAPVIVPLPAASRALPAPSPPQPTTASVPDRLRVLALACLAAALAIAVFGWPVVKPAAGNRPPAGDGVMMRGTVQDRHPG
jgi:hypothetical protein